MIIGQSNQSLDMKLQSTPNTVFRHQSKYLQPTVIKVWKQQQQELVEELKEDYNSKVILAGDGRSDSPGHCAKYGSYTVIEQQLNKVLDIQVVQVSFNSLWESFSAQLGLFP